jgi:hypothetical protein
MIVTRALNNPEFRNRLKADPEKTLLAEGLPPGMAEELARELAVDGQPPVIACQRTCGWLSCWWTCRKTAQ